MSALRAWWGHLHRMVGNLCGQGGPEGSLEPGALTGGCSYDILGTSIEELCWISQGGGRSDTARSPRGVCARYMRMPTIKECYVVDEKGTRISVVLDIGDYRHLLEELEATA